LEQQSALSPQLSVTFLHEAHAPSEHLNPEQHCESEEQEPLTLSRQETHWLEVVLHAFEQQFAFVVHGFMAPISKHEHRLAVQILEQQLELPKPEHDWLMPRHEAHKELLLQYPLEHCPLDEQPAPLDSTQ